jgi:lipoprotein signal peptidase
VSVFRLKLVRHFRAHWLFYVLAAAGLVIDLGSKTAAFSSIDHNVIFVLPVTKIDFPPAIPLTESRAEKIEIVLKDARGRFNSLIEKSIRGEKIPYKKWESAADDTEAEMGKILGHVEFQEWRKTSPWRKDGFRPMAVAIFGSEIPDDEIELAPPRKTVIPSFFNIQLTFNPGAMFGMFQNVTFLIIFTFAALAVIVYALTRLEGNERAYQVGLALIAAGAIANLYDRMVWHVVRDFLDFSVEFWPSLANWLIKIRGVGDAGAHWHTFNFADIFILVGVVLIFIKQMFTKKPEREAKPAKAA